MPGPDEEQVTDFRLGVGEPLRITNLPPIEPDEEIPAGYWPPQAITSGADTRIQALEERVDALARLAQTQQGVNRRLGRIRTSTAVIAVLGWATAIVALAVR